MISRSEKIRLSIFLVTAGALIIIAVIVLAGLRLSQKSDMYYVRFDESVSGLEIGAQVKYNGVRVGQVVDIRLDEKKLDATIVELSLREGTPIKKDTEAIMVAMGITGLKFVELQGGSSKSKAIEPGSFIKSGQSLIGTLEGKAEDIAVKFELALNSINSVLSQRNVHNFSQILENTNEATESISASLSGNKNKIDELISNLHAASEDLKKGMASAKNGAKRFDELIEVNQPQIASIFENVKQTSNRFRRTAESLSRVDDILKDISQALNHFNNQLQKVDIGQMADDAEATLAQTKNAARSVRQLVEASRSDIHQSSKSLRKTLRNIEELSKELRDQPSLLLSSEPPKERKVERLSND